MKEMVLGMRLTVVVAGVGSAPVRGLLLAAVLGLLLIAGWGLLMAALFAGLRERMLGTTSRAVARSFDLAPVREWSSATAWVFLMAVFDCSREGMLGMASTAGATGFASALVRELLSAAAWGLMLTAGFGLLRAAVFPLLSLLTQA